MKRLTRTDQFFAILRLCTFVFGLLLMRLYPFISHHKALATMYLFFVFFLYSTLMYGAIFLYHEHKDKIYKGVMVLDLLFISTLTHLTGAWESDFFLGLYLLIALHTFYFGMVFGLKVTGVAALLYIVTLFEDYPYINVANMVIRLTFMWLVCVSVGLVYSQLQQMHDKLKQGYVSVVDALIEAVHSKDPYTQKHSHRVAFISLQLAQELGFSKEEQEYVHLAAMLHDIGKIGIPESILLKPGKLTEDEWVVVKEHPATGEKILYPVRLPDEVKKMVRHHHEWYDGSGYPDGIKGSKIPLEARLIAVADVFEAMTSERPYRGPYSDKEAYQEITLNSGTHFDPALVKAFVRWFEKVNGKKDEKGSDMREMAQDLRVVRIEETGKSDAGEHLKKATK